MGCQGLIIHDWVQLEKPPAVLGFPPAVMGFPPTMISTTTSNFPQPRRHEIAPKFLFIAIWAQLQW